MQYQKGIAWDLNPSNCSRDGFGISTWLRCNFKLKNNAEPNIKKCYIIFH
jgi:hypothetical protein